MSALFLILFTFGMLAVTCQMLKPIQLSRPLFLIKNRFDTMFVNGKDQMLFVQVKGDVHGRQRKPEPVTQYQAS